MRHRKSKITLSRTAAARNELRRKLAISLLTHGKIETSGTKSKFLQQFVEPLVTKARKGDLGARRLAIRALGNRDAAQKLLTRAANYRERAGGYTRVTKLPGRRPGDGAERVLIEFV